MAGNQAVVADKSWNRREATWRTELLEAKKGEVSLVKRAEMRGAIERNP